MAGWAQHDLQQRPIRSVELRRRQREPRGAGCSVVAQGLRAWRGSRAHGLVCDLVEWNDVQVGMDVGCGSGRFLPSLARRCERVIAVDLSLAMLAEVRATSPELALVGDVCRLPVRDGCVDAVLAAWMLYHAADPDLACAELRRILRPGGVLIAVTNAASHTAELDEVYAEATAALLGDSPPPPRLPSNGFALDQAAAHLSRHFTAVTIHVRRTAVHVPDPAPIVRYLASLRSYADETLREDGFTFDDLVPHIETAAARRIVAHGAVVVTGLPAAVVCR